MQFSGKSEQKMRQAAESAMQSRKLELIKNYPGRITARNLETIYSNNLTKLEGYLKNQAILENKIAKLMPNKIGTFSVLNYLLRYLFPTSKRLKSSIQELQENTEKIRALPGLHKYHPLEDKHWMNFLESQVVEYIKNHVKEKDDIIVTRILPFITEYNNGKQSSQAAHTEWEMLKLFCKNNQEATTILAKISAIDPNFSSPTLETDNKADYHPSFVFSYLNLYLKKLGVLHQEKAQQKTKDTSQASNSIDEHSIDPIAQSITNAEIVSKAMQNSTDSSRKEELADLGINQVLLRGLETGKWYQTCCDIHDYQKYSPPEQNKSYASGFFIPAEQKIHPIQLQIQKKVSAERTVFVMFQAVLELKEKSTLSNSQKKVIHKFEELLRELEIPRIKYDPFMNVENFERNKQTIDELRSQLSEIIKIPGAQRIETLLTYILQRPMNEIDDYKELLQKEISENSEAKALGITPNEPRIDHSIK
ncbi:MAG: hypothetical protein P1U74_07175 [Legionellaceae bacterium]|nr:hypothetical protein [Legionellaceae bacterium]